MQSQEISELELKAIEKNKEELERHKVSTISNILEQIKREEIIYKEKITSLRKQIKDTEGLVIVPNVYLGSWTSSYVA